MRDIKNFANNVSFIRKNELYITQEELAERLNISRDTVSNIERGITVPNVKTLLKLASITDKPIDYFFERNKEPFDIFWSVRESAYIDGKKVTTYGIQSAEQYFPNVFTNRKQSEELVHRLNNSDIQPCHLMDVIFDAIG